MEFTYWYLFPVAIVIATVANGAGIGGATFFSPLFILALQLEPRVAIGAALTTEVFGLASGVIAHTRARTIDWSVARHVGDGRRARRRGWLTAGRNSFHPTCSREYSPLGYSQSLWSSSAITTQTTRTPPSLPESA